MVIEFLTFDIDPAHQQQWLDLEEQCWSRFLEQQAGFVDKQMWRSLDDSHRIHSVIRWESMQHWEAIPQAELAAVAASMGASEREPAMAAFDLIRDC